MTRLVETLEQLLLAMLHVAAVDAPLPAAVLIGIVGLAATAALAVAVLATALRRIPLRRRRPRPAVRTVPACIVAQRDPDAAGSVRSRAPGRPAPAV